MWVINYDGYWFTGYRQLGAPMWSDDIERARLLRSELAAKHTMRDISEDAHFNPDAFEIVKVKIVRDDES